MSDNGNSYLNYIKNSLIGEIIANLKCEKLDDFKIEHSKGLDGFMSTLYTIQLKTKTANGSKERLLIAKFMRGDANFRETSKSYIQFANEIYIYGTVLPAYDEILKQARITDVAVKKWVAPIYMAKFGFIEGLSATPTDREAVLVLENLNPLGYTMGPRLYLNREQLLGMCKPLAEFHALSYVLHVQNKSLLERLKTEIVPFPFINDADPNDFKDNYYRVIYRIAFDRFFDYFDYILANNKLDQKNADDLKLIERVRVLKEKYFDEPTRLLERFRTQIEESEEDRRFGAILHGDYNRNNVLFRFKQCKENAGEACMDEVEDVKMIDFQQMRYGTPAIDLSFFMYFNTPDDLREKIWLELLNAYHGRMFETLSRVVKSTTTNPDEVEEQLKQYNFEHFNAHFSRYAFYGVMICMHFLPWMLCDEKECAEISRHFASDIHGKEFRELCLKAGGDEVKAAILNVVRHACKMGYMDDI